MASISPARAAALLTVLFSLGFAVTLFSFIDLQWTRLVLVDDTQPRAATRAAADPRQLQRLRQSIVSVRAQCGDSASTAANGFVVKPGFVATAANVLGPAQRCSGPIRLLDYKGLEHPAQVAGIALDDDFALLRIADASLPSLKLADAARYETARPAVRLATIGASPRGAISGEGTLSRFLADRNVFLASGLNPDSGGPIFVRDDWTVLGIGRSRLPNVAEGAVASIRAFERFFREKTGQELR